jgi:hypothetical protein
LDHSQWMGVVLVIMAATIAVFGFIERSRSGSPTMLNGAGMGAIAMPQGLIGNMDLTPYVFGAILGRQAR